MKKKMFFVVLTAVVLTLSGCQIKEPKLQNHLSPKVFQVSDAHLDSTVTTKIPKGRDLTEQEYADFSDLFKEILAFYSIEKTICGIEILHKKEMSDFFSEDMHACYVSNNQTIYLLDSFDFKNDVDKKTLVHEILHYLSDNGENSRGLLKVSSGKEVNRLLNEGATEFLTWKFAGNNSANTPYLFQVLFISEFEILFGEELLLKAYFTSEDAELREAFNQAVSLHYGDFYSRVYNSTFDPYDTFGCSLMSVAIFENAGMMEQEGELLAALQEEILFAARSCGKTQEIQERFRSFWEVDLEITDSSFLNEFVQYDYLKKIK